MMKERLYLKLLLMSVVIATALFSGMCFAETNFYVSDYQYDADGVGAVTLNVNAYASDRMMVTGIRGYSDLSGATLTIQRYAISALPTVSYSTVDVIPYSKLPLTGSTDAPVVLGEKGYRYQFLLTGTSANALVVNGVIGDYDGTTKP